MSDSSTESEDSEDEVVSPRKTPRFVRRDRGPKPIFETTLSNLEVRISDKVVLEVKSGNAPVKIVEWFRDNELLRPSERISMVTEGNVHRLEIMNVTEDDEGMIKCVLINDAGSIASTAEFLVEGKYQSALQPVSCQSTDFWSRWVIKIHTPSDLRGKFHCTH